MQYIPVFYFSAAGSEFFAFLSAFGVLCGALFIL
jgi:hypothetical protein